MKKGTLGIVLFSVLTSSHVMANECSYKTTNERPTIPNGLASNIEEMTAVRTEVIQYVELESARYNCIHNDHIKQHVANRIHNVADDFNVELRRFKKLLGS